MNPVGRVYCWLPQKHPWRSLKRLVRTRMKPILAWRKNSNTNKEITVSTTELWQDTKTLYKKMVCSLYGLRKQAIPGHQADQDFIIPVHAIKHKQISLHKNLDQRVCEYALARDRTFIGVDEGEGYIPYDSRCKSVATNWRSTKSTGNVLYFCNRLESCNLHNTTGTQKQKEDSLRYIRLPSCLSSFPMTHKQCAD